MGRSTYSTCIQPPQTHAWRSRSSSGSSVIVRCAGFTLAAVLLVQILSTGQAATSEPPVLLGLYTSDSLMVSASEIVEVDNWLGSTGVGVSIAGTFMDLEWPDPANNVPAELNAAWSRGYMPFVNLSVGSIVDPAIIAGLPAKEAYPHNRTAAFVANDSRLDSSLRAWARAFAEWTEGGRRKAFIAPLHEMNGGWVPYGLDPSNFKRAYHRFRQVFREEGVSEEAVRWVFAANGWSAPAHRFEAYYPGNASVDVVAFVSFNYGACKAGEASWNTFDVVFKPFLERMSLMAPSKPIFIDQTGTVTEGGDKNQWLYESYTRLAAYPGLRGILYFHRRKYEGLPCNPVDYRFYAPSEGIVFEGIRDALRQSGAGFGHWPLSDPGWSSIAFVSNPRANAFEDVEPAHPFAGVEDVWYYRWVEGLAAVGLTSGCGSDPLSGQPLYCPHGLLSRAEIAVFTLKGMNGASYRPPAPNGSSPFQDILGHWARSWIEELYDQGLARGYPDGTYRPENPVTRAEMAVFMLRARHGAAYTPPRPDGGAFRDIAGHWAEAWIEQLKEEGVVSGYSDGSYRPEQYLTRAQVAVFLLRAFDLLPS